MAQYRSRSGSIMPAVSAPDPPSHSSTPVARVARTPLSEHTRSPASVSSRRPGEAELREAEARYSAIIADAALRSLDEQRGTSQRGGAEAGSGSATALMRERLATLRAASSGLSVPDRGILDEAIRVLAEYESAVREQERGSTERIARAMEDYTGHWIKKTQEFEATKARFEHDVVGRALSALREYEQEARQKDSELQERLVSTLRQQSEARLAQEQSLLMQAESYRLEYKQMQDREYEVRCRQFEDHLIARQREALAEVEGQRQRLRDQEVMMRDLAAEAHNTAQDQALASLATSQETFSDEMEALRQQLRRELNKEREGMHRELLSLKRSSAEEVQEATRRMREEVDAARREASNAEMRGAEREAEAQRVWTDEARRLREQREADFTAFKETTEKRYFERLHELREEHKKERYRITAELSERRDAGSADSFRREQELRMSYEAKQREFEALLQSKYVERLQTHQETEAALRDQAVEVLHRQGELEARLKDVEASHQSREQEWHARMVRTDREAEEKRAAHEIELKKKYDQFFQEAIDSAEKQTADKAELRRAMEELKTLGERYQAVLEKEKAAWEHEKQALVGAVENCTREDNARVARLEHELIQKAAEVRVELEADARRREADVERQLTTERKRLWDEATSTSVLEKRDRAEFESRVMREQRNICTQLVEDAHRRADERERNVQATLAAREVELDNRETAVRHEQSTSLAVLEEERHRLQQQTHERQAELEAELRAQMQQQMRAERQALQEELRTIRTRADEERRRAEEQRAALQRQTQEARAEALNEARAQFLTLSERQAEEHRRVTAAREESAAEKLRLATERNLGEVERLRKEHRDEVDRLRGLLEGERVTAERDAAEHRKGLEAELSEARRMCADSQGALRRVEDDAQRRCLLETDAARREKDVEIARLLQEREAAEKRIRAEALAREEQLRADAAAELAAEKERSRRSEREVQAAADRARLEAEANARREAQAFVDAQRRKWDAALEDRRREEELRLSSFRQEVISREETLARQQRDLEESTQTRVEQMVREALTASADSSQQQLQAAREEVATLKAQLVLATQTAQIGDKGGVADEAVAEVAEGRVEEIRAALERQHADNLSRTEERLESALRTAQSTAEERVRRLEADHREEIDTLRERFKAERTELQDAVHNRERDFVTHATAVAEQAGQKHDEQVGELREIYDRKLREKDEQERDRSAAYEKQKLDYEGRVRGHFESLLKEQERRASEMQEERESQRVAHEREREKLILSLRQELDAVRIGEDAKVEQRVRERLSEVARSFEEEKERSLAQVAEERRARAEAEAARDTATGELTGLRVEMAQWKQETTDALVSKYERLFSELQSKTRKDREDFARKMLEEEEKRLAKELVRKDHELGRSKEAQEQEATRETELRLHKVREYELQQRERRDCEMLCRRTSRLQQLWQTLAAPPAEKISLLDAVVRRCTEAQLHAEGAAQGLLAGLTEEIAKEVRRVEAQLPLMELITRREFIKDKLRQGTSGVGPSAQDLSRELLSIDGQLASQLPAYEAEFQARLLFKDQRYLHVLERDRGTRILDP
eukprot:Hpha_TRINITY_DN16862_c2_g7::TRINITY_DN16862_c2_g7_i1::g.150650::m.150650